jgi:hypothetical protein
MKNISSCKPEYNGKIGKKVCRDVIDRVKIWKNTGKIWKKSHMRILPRNLPVFYHSKTLCIGLFYLFFLFYQQMHTQKKKSFRTNGCGRDIGGDR